MVVSVAVHLFPVEKLNAVHLLLDTFGGSRTISNTSTTNYTQISSFSFDHSGQIVSASFQVTSSVSWRLKWSFLLCLFFYLHVTF